MRASWRVGIIFLIGFAVLAAASEGLRAVVSNMFPPPKANSGPVPEPVMAEQVHELESLNDFLLRAQTQNFGLEKTLRLNAQLIAYAIKNGCNPNFTPNAMPPACPKSSPSETSVARTKYAIRATLGTKEINLTTHDQSYDYDLAVVNYYAQSATMPADIRHSLSELAKLLQRTDVGIWRYLNEKYQRAPNDFVTNLDDSSPDFDNVVGQYRGRFQAIAPAVQKIRGQIRTYLQTD